MTTQAESGSSSGSRYACATCRVLFRSAFHRCPLDAGDLVALAAGDDPLLGATLGGRYRIEELVGDGEVGRHYRASHVELPRHFTVVVPYGEIAAVGASRGRFRRGAQAASKLDHAGVVPVVDVAENEERLLYVVMDEVVGRDLRSIISWDSPLAPERAMSLARQLARALEHAHGHGVRHGDLRPEDVIVVEQDGGEVARISGFGLAAQPADAQRDLYRLGVLFYEMLAGCPPFDDEDAFDGVGMVAPPIRERAPEATPQPELEAVTRRLLAGEQAARYRSAAAVVADLETVGAAPEPASDAPRVADNLAAAFDLAIAEPDRPVLLPARPARPAPRPASTDDEPLVTERRRRVAISAFVVGVLVAFGSVAFALLRSKSPEAPVASAAPIADAAPPVPPPSPVAATPPPAVVDAAPPAAPPETADAAPPPTAPRRKVAIATPPARPTSRARARYPEEEVTDAPPPEPPPDAAPPSRPDAAPPPAAPDPGSEKTAASRQAAETLVRDGAKLYLAGRADEAKKKFQGALLLDSRSAAAHRGLGFVYQKLGDRAKAAEHLRRYLDLAPDARDADEIRTRLRSLEE